MQRHAKPDMTPEDMADLLQMVDFEIMERVRKRAETVVRDPTTAEALKPWYNWLCKRPCFHDEYLDVFNQDNVTLVDTEGRGIDRISGNVVVANGEEFELDLLIFATGFELSPYEEGSPIPVTGRDGQTLAEKWKEGATTLHGQHVHGFPNLMLSTTRQASWENNFPFPQDVVATNLAKLIRHALDEGVATFEVTAEAEADWVRFHEEKSWPSHARWKECTPSYFNQEGNGRRPAHPAERRLRRLDHRAARHPRGVAGGRHARPHDVEGGMTVQTLQSTVLAEGFTYGEGPRWRDGRLWFSDMHADAVRTLDADGALGLGAEHPSPVGHRLDAGRRPARDVARARGAAPDHTRRAAGALRPQRVRPVAERHGGPAGRTRLRRRVHPSGAAAPRLAISRSSRPTARRRSSRQGLATPNGLAVTADGTTLVAAETFGNRLPRLDDPGRRRASPTSGCSPTSVSASPTGSASTSRVGCGSGASSPASSCACSTAARSPTALPIGESWAVAPALGGPDMRTLHLVVNDTTFEGLATGDSTCRIETVEVDVPGAGSP